MLPLLTEFHWRETRHVYCRLARFPAFEAATVTHGARSSRHRRPAYPPAKGGSTSTTSPSSSTIDSLVARPTGSAFTRKDDRARTAARRPSGFLLETAVLSRSPRVSASMDSSATPAASFAAAQYLMVILGIWDILSSTG